MANATRYVNYIRKPRPNRYSFILLAAQAGTRMRSYGSKSLLRINNKPLIQHQINCIRETYKTYAKSLEIILVTGFEADKVMNNTPEDIIKIENERFEETNSARNLSLGLRAATGDIVCVIDGDLAFNSESIKCGNRLISESTIVIDSTSEKDKDTIGCNVCNGQIEFLIYDLPNQWRNISFFTGTELTLLKKIAWDKNRQNNFVFEIINEIINKNGTFKAFSDPAAKSINIDSSKELELAEKLIQCR